MLATRPPRETSTLFLPRSDFFPPFLHPRSPPPPLLPLRRFNFQFRFFLLSSLCLDFFKERGGGGGGGEARKRVSSIQRSRGMSSSGRKKERKNGRGRRKGRREREREIKGSVSKGYWRARDRNGAERTEWRVRARSNANNPPAGPAMPFSFFPPPSPPPSSSTPSPRPATPIRFLSVHSVHPLSALARQPAFVFLYFPVFPGGPHAGRSLVCRATSSRL